jgi:hypothetical protein
VLGVIAAGLLVELLVGRVERPEVFLVDLERGPAAELADDPPVDPAEHQRQAGRPPAVLADHP